jgi:putative RNA 2'-phosphotransferase
MAKHSQAVEKLAKLLDYVLGRQPDEFGLVTDAEGYVRVKDLLKALSEEPGWRHVRLNHIRETVMTLRQPTVELSDSRIRALDRSCLIPPASAETLPKLLYHAVRRRAWPVVLEKGVTASDAAPQIVLAQDLPMAQRLGRRIDPSPVILTVNTSRARQLGMTFMCAGRRLFTIDRLLPGTFSGPPLPKQPAEPKKRIAPDEPKPSRTPGSFLLDVSHLSEPQKRQAKDPKRRQRKNQWKRDRKRMQRGGGSGWPDD